MTVPQTAEGSISLEDGGTFTPVQLIAAQFRDGEYIYAFRGTLADSSGAIETEPSTQTGESAPGVPETPAAPADSTTAPSSGVSLDEVKSLVQGEVEAIRSEVQAGLAAVLEAVKGSEAAEATPPAADAAPAADAPNPDEAPAPVAPEQTPPTPAP
jgi:hypothetical protein